MTAVFTEWIKLLRRDRPAVERVMIALLSLVVAAVLGVMARRRDRPLRQELVGLHASAQKIEDFRAAYRPTPDSALDRATRAVDSLNVGILAGARLPLAQAVAQVAETAGLAGVRVRFGTPDSLFIPPRTAGDAAKVEPATYTIVLGGQGSFAALLTLLNSLPPSVAVVRIGAENSKSAAQFRITLAVYEVPDVNQRG
jgi:hypothetical protein